MLLQRGFSARADSRATLSVYTVAPVNRIRLSPSLVLLSLLVLSACDTSDTTVDEVPAPSTLVARYGKLKVGTYEVRLPKRRLAYAGDSVRINQYGTIFMHDEDTGEIRAHMSSYSSKTFDIAPVNLDWMGSYAEDSGGGKNCSGNL